MDATSFLVVYISAIQQKGTIFVFEKMHCFLMIYGFL